MIKLHGSYRTSLAGLGAIFVAVGGAITAMTDNDPATMPDWTITLAALAAGFGLLTARDNRVTSEEAIPKPRE